MTRVTVWLGDRRLVLVPNEAAGGGGRNGRVLDFKTEI